MLQHVDLTLRQSSASFVVQRLGEDLLTLGGSLEVATIANAGRSLGMKPTAP